MTGLVFTKTNGKVHAHVDHICARSCEPKLGEEITRVSIHPEDASRSINTLIVLHQADYWRALRAVAA